MTLNQRSALWLCLSILCLLPFTAQAQDTALPQLIYSSAKGRPEQLYIVNADGTDAHPLDDRKTYEAFPVVSPDGSTIAYLGQDADGNNNVFLMDRDGANPRRLTDLGQCAFDVPWYVWSPDSQSVAVSYFCGAENAGHVVILGLDGTLVKELSVARAGVISSLGGWTPDGAALIINGHVPSSSGFDVSTIFGYDLKTDSLRTILSRDDILDGRLSPDGTQIVFVQTVDRVARELYVLDVNSGAVRQLTIDDPQIRGIRSPAWSPDGSLIAFASFRGSSPDILRINADGSGLMRITDYERASSPTWLAPAASSVAANVNP